MQRLINGSHVDAKSLLSWYSFSFYADGSVFTLQLCILHSHAMHMFEQLGPTFARKMPEAQFTQMVLNCRRSSKQVSKLSFLF